MMIARTVVLFVLAATAGLGGAWLVWHGLKGNRGWVWAGAGFLVLAFCGRSKGESSFGRVMAAYGGLFTVGTLVWGISADGIHPDAWGSGRRRHHHVRCLGRAGLARVAEH